MNWLSFFSSVIDSLAWPVAVIIIFFVLKKPLSTLLPMLRNLKYKDLELDFGRELKKLEDTANQILSIETKPKEIGEKPVDRNSSQIIKDAERLFDDFPGPAVALAWSAVEIELREAIRRTASSTDYTPPKSILKNAIFLQNSGYLKADEIKLIDRMRKLRNMAVHEGIVPADDAREFITLTKWLAEDLKEIKKR